MDTAHLVELLRALRTTPSRRALGTALVALAAHTTLAPFIDHAAARGKGGGGGGNGGGGKGGGGGGNGGGKGNGNDKNKDKDNKKKKGNIDELPPLPPAPQCAVGESFCTTSGG